MGAESGGHPLGGRPAALMASLVDDLGVHSRSDPCLHVLALGFAHPAEHAAEPDRIRRFSPGLDDEVQRRSTTRFRQPSQSSP